MNRVPKLRFPEFSGEWEERKVGDTGKIIGGGTPSTKEESYWQGNIPWISSSDLSEKTIEKIRISRFITEEAISKSATKLVPKNSILIVSRVGVGKVAVSNYDLCTSQDFANLIPFSEYSPKFLANQIKIQTENLLEFNQGTSIKGFVKNDLENLDIYIPSLPEQQEIASFLSSVDSKIEKLERKKELWEQYKKGMMQKIFSQELRFKDENGEDYPEWEEKSLGEVLIKNSIKNKENKISRVQSISNKLGFVEQEDLFQDRVVASRDKKNYYVIEKGIFAYNPSRIDVGSLAYQKDNIVSVISPLYISFRANQDFLSDEFLLNWFDGLEFIKQMQSSFEGSVRNTLSYDSLSNISINIPPLPEQTQIANFLSSIDSKIEIVSKELTGIKEFKKGLLQQMFV